MHQNRDCGCTHINRHSFRFNLASVAQHITYEGRDTLVVPVVMMKSGVVMNDCLVPTEELHPETWNGVPVTLHHPPDSANKPDVLAEYKLGTIFNARVDNGDLKAEAWIDVERTNARAPGLIAQLEAGQAMDVSTGYFSGDVAQAGTSKGRAYTLVSRNLNPDHLALLPGETGACSWEDGCGVRANVKGTEMADDDKDEKVSIGAISRLLQSMGFGNPKENRRGADDDYRQMVADLISDDRSPFVPADEDSLRFMSYETLSALRDQYLGEPAGNKQNHKESTTVPNDNQDGGLPKTREELNTLVANAVKDAMSGIGKQVTDAVTTAVGALKDNLLSADDKAALERATKLNADHRTQLIDKIVANSDMKKEQIEKWDTPQLELVANGLRVVEPDYSSRGIPTVNAADKDDPAVKAMVVPSSKDAIITNRKDVH